MKFSVVGFQFLSSYQQSAFSYQIVLRLIADR